MDGHTQRDRDSEIRHQPGLGGVVVVTTIGGAVVMIGLGVVISPIPYVPLRKPGISQ